MDLAAHGAIDLAVIEVFAVEDSAPDRMGRSRDNLPRPNTSI